MKKLSDIMPDFPKHIKHPMGNYEASVNHFIDMCDKPLQEVLEHMEIEFKVKFFDLIRKHWSFNENQQPTSSWHDREDFIEMMDTKINSMVQIKDEKRV